MTISRRLRFEILRRDNHACRYCGANAPDATLTVDHVIPVALGGTHIPENLVTACKDCNAGKAATNPDAPLVVDVAADAIRWAAAMRRAAEIDGAQYLELARITNAILAEWEAWTTYRGTMADNLPDDWRFSIERFLAAGLTEQDLLLASLRALTNKAVNARDKWKYVCGICWRTLERRQETARALIDSEDVE